MTGTGGGRSGTDGGRWLARRDRIALVTVAAATLMVAVVNALSVADEMTEAGLTVDAWEPWVWELTSAVFWILIALPLIRLLRRVRPPRVGWPAAVGAVLLLSVPVCALHMGFLALSRGAAYALLGLSYTYDWSWSQTVYEWRKDVLSVAIFAILSFVIDQLTAAPAAAPPPSFRLEVRDGSRTLWFAPAEIERVEAAGNYVELHTAAGPVLHRATLAAVADILAAHGFVRIHRSRLVRRDAVTAVTTTPSGDFEARLSSGATVAGSRRFRADLKA
jgi:hypothetical protein